MSYKTSLLGTNLSQRCSRILKEGIILAVKAKPAHLDLYISHILSILGERWLGFDADLLRDAPTLNLFLDLHSGAALFRPIKANLVFLLFIFSLQALRLFLGCCLRPQAAT